MKLMFFANYLLPILCYLLKSSFFLTLIPSLSKTICATLVTMIDFGNSLSSATLRLSPSRDISSSPPDKLMPCVAWISIWSLSSSESKESWNKKVNFKWWWFFPLAQQFEFNSNHQNVKQVWYLNSRNVMNEWKFYSLKQWYFYEWEHLSKIVYDYMLCHVALIK